MYLTKTKSDKALTNDHYYIQICLLITALLRVRPRGSGYNGTVNSTISGRTCQHWSAQSPHSHRYHGLADQRNYCREPNDDGAPWCYTTDDDQPTEFCLIHAAQGQLHAVKILTVRAVAGWLVR